MPDYSSYDFAKVMNYPDDFDQFYIFDFTKGYDAEFIRSKGWGIGRYNEQRTNMYDTPLFDSRRNIHMAIDVWYNADAPVYSFWEGTVAYKQENDNAGDYGPTIVIKYELNDQTLFSLYGHLSRKSLDMVTVGENVNKGQQIATLGDESVNGGWAPHLHFQLAHQDPGEADMPGVVAEEDHEEALQNYPDPRTILGNLY